MNKIIAHAQILSGLYETEMRDYDPVRRASKVFYKWYETHSKDVPIPEDQLPTQEEIAEWVRERELYVAEGIVDKFGWSGLKAYAEGRPAHKDIYDSILSETKPCAGGDCQCTWECKYYGGSECK